MGFEIKGLKEFQNKLATLQRKAEALDGTHNVGISELLNAQFLSECSRFCSVDEMFQASGFKVETSEDFAAIPDEEWDQFIVGNTHYSSWKEMKSAAATAWAKRKLGL